MGPKISKVAVQLLKATTESLHTPQEQDAQQLLENTTGPPCRRLTRQSGMSQPISTQPICDRAILDLYETIDDDGQQSRDRLHATVFQNSPHVYGSGPHYACKLIIPA